MYSMTSLRSAGFSRGRVARDRRIIDDTPMKPTSQTFNTAGYFWSLAALGIVVAAIGPSLPELAARTGHTLGVIGFVFPAYRVGYIAGSLGGGAALDRMPGNRLLAVAIVMMAGAFAMVPVVPTLLTLLVLFSVVGVAAGVVEVGGNTLLVWLYRDRVGPWMNALHFAFGVGAILSPILIGQAMRLTGSLNPAFLIGAAVSLPGAVLLMRGATPDAPPRGTDGDDRSDTPMVVLVSVLLLLYVGAEASYGGWIYTWATETHALPPARAATATAVFWAMLTVGRFLAIPVSARWSPQVILIGSVGGAGISIALLASPLGGAHEAVLWLSSVGAGLSLAAIFPTTMSFAGRYMRVSGTVSRWFFIGAGVGGMTVPWLMGQLMDGPGAVAVMPAILVVVGLMGTVLTVLLRRVATAPPV
jgi:FHS family Na+ dependent glucose MFS transporter 1